MGNLKSVLYDKMYLKGVFLLATFAISAAREYCQPGDQSCWPSSEEIEAFKSSLLPVADECLPFFPTFSSKDDKGQLLYNNWYDEMPVLLTPYDFLNLRNYMKETKAYFVVLARGIDDVSKAVTFARDHNLALSIFGTGHEFQDRNAALAPNGVLIRTICLRAAQVDLDSENRFGHPEGVIRVGSGMTWGTSKFNFKGVHEIAKENGRVVISGHAAEVGVVGWSMGGGHSPLGPVYGLGVDQMLEVELVGADGSYIIANANGTSVQSFDGSKVEVIEDNSLFWAMRGGGAGPWGAVTAMTIKLHKPVNDCQKSCYHVTNAHWIGKFSQDNGKLAEDLVATFVSFASQASQFWSGYFTIGREAEDRYQVTVAELMYQGNADDEDANFLKDFFSNFPDPDYYEVKSYNTYFDKTEAQGPETVYTANPSSFWTSVLLNQSVLANQADDFAASLRDMWIPRCYLEGDFRKPCTSGYMLYLTFPKNDDNVDGTSVAKKFREANLHVSSGTAANLAFDLTYEEQEDFIHNVLSPELYKYGEGSYYSESEYSMVKGQWQNRLWDEETYLKLLQVKQTWDPEHIFGCRHCIGDEEPEISVSKKTLPSWRFFH